MGVRLIQECSVTIRRASIAVRSKAVVVALGAAIVLMLASCSMFSQSAADRVVGGVPEGFREGSVVPVQSYLASPRAGWVNDEEFGIVLTGSSSCPPVVTKMRALSADEITFSVNFSRLGRGHCTDDAAPRTHIFQVPPEVTERPIRLIPESFSEIDHILLP